MKYTLQSWKQDGEYFAFKNYKIFYRFAGKQDAPTLFLIHGYPTSSFDWSKIWDELSEQYQILAIDLLGLGFSDKPSKHVYSVQDHAAQCVALLEHLNLKRVHLIGHDLGAGILQELLHRQQAQHLPFNIQSAIFMNGSLFPEAYQPRFIQKLMASSFGHLIGLLLNKRIFSKNMKQMFDVHHPPSDADLAQWYEQLNFNDGKKCLVALNRSIFERFKHRDRLVAALMESQIPMLLINGQNDPNSGTQMAKRYRELVPHPQVVELTDCGHWTPWEKPEIVAREVLTFLSSAFMIQPAFETE